MIEQTQRKLKIGIVGGAGYTAGELLRIILRHPMVKVDFVYSTSSAGAPLHSIHYDLLGVTDLWFLPIRSIPRSMSCSSARRMGTRGISFRKTRFANTRASLTFRTNSA